MCIRDSLTAEARAYLAACPRRQGYIQYWLRGYSRTALRSLQATLESTVEYLSNSRERIIVIKLMDYPILRSLWLYHPANHTWESVAAMVIFPLAVPLWLIGLREQRILRGEIEKIISVSAQLTQLIEHPQPKDQ